MIRALALTGTLTPSPAESSTDKLAGEVLQALEGQGVTGELIRVVDLDVKPGVEVDMGDGDAWPGIRKKILDADILVICTPIWLGHPSSVTQRVLERLDAELSETDDAGRPVVEGKVAIVGVVGNKDGAHKVMADLYQALSDVGFTIPSQGGVYWVGEAMQTVDYKDLEQTPDTVADTTAALARNAAHLATLLRREPYPSS